MRTHRDLNQEHHSVLSDNQRQFINKSVRPVIVDLSETIGEPESVNKFLHTASITLQQKRAFLQVTNVVSSTFQDYQGVKY